MKRLWLGIILLAALVVLGLFETARMGALTDPIADRLVRAAQAAREEDWVRARQLSEEARESWEENWSFLAAMHHHGPMEEIDSQFARAEVLLESRAGAEFSACCARIGEMIRALGDTHAVNLRNLLSCLGRVP